MHLEEWTPEVEEGKADIAHAPSDARPHLEVVIDPWHPSDSVFKVNGVEIPIMTIKIEQHPNHEDCTGELTVVIPFSAIDSFATQDISKIAPQETLPFPG